MSVMTRASQPLPRNVPARQGPSSRRSRRPGDLDFRDRARAFRDLEQETHDLIVIGGGITGAGLARAAAARGLRVALLEARDLASGTSSRSSKMIHGGLRYLAQGDVALVREAATERQILRRIAPHLTRFMPFLLPTRSTTGMARFRAAMWAFEKLGKIPPDERHEVWSAAELAEREPLAAIQGSHGAVVYFEFLTDDARLTLANARSAAGDGARILTYAPVTSIELENGRAVGVHCESVLEGESLGAFVRGSVIVNAAGPWVDAIRALESADETPRLALTRGIHLVLPRERLPISRTVLMNAIDKRPVFAVPRGEVVYLGTTDTFHDAREYWPAIETADVDYLLEAASRSFRTDPITPADIVSSWTGLRPLVSQKGKSPSEISRRDEVWTGPGGILSIAGGKLTAYRRMVERVTDTVVERIENEQGRGAFAPAGEERPLVGGDLPALPVDDEARSGHRQPDRLAELYGSEAAEVAADGGDLRAEVRQAVRREGVLRLEDYWIRRSARAFFDVDAGLSKLEEAADEMARELAWSETRRRTEIEACRRRHESNNVLFERARKAARHESAASPRQDEAS
ncbi:MAG TPA: glycerol-3-phosphate dehydrogenase/oxidase [Deltaproteobacteria bacterium]|nr:glycerol-3-phosphate dehydrogenase/oxidase [Deltaproteobacteria bacterium]